MGYFKFHFTVKLVLHDLFISGKKAESLDAVISKSTFTAIRFWTVPLLPYSTIGDHNLSLKGTPSKVLES